jgi:hypothetical protein
MRKRRKTPTREELRRLARRRRVAEAWMNGASAAAIAKSERISPAAVYADLRLAQDVILPAGTREQLLARNYERLEAVIRANREGVEKGEDIATRNAVKALSEQNRMLGVNGASVNNNFMVNTGQPVDGSNDLRVLVQFPTTVERPDGSVWVEGAPHPGDAPLPEPPTYAYPRLKLIEHKPAEPAPFPPDPPSNPERPRTEVDRGLQPGWVMDAPPPTKKNWMG